MRLVLAGVGRLKSGPERELFDRYGGWAKSLARRAGLTGVDLVEVEEGRGRASEERKRQEAVALVGKLQAGTYLVCLDERGTVLTSPQLAATIARQRDAGTASFTVAVGGPDGFEEAVRDRSDLCMSFGAATLPHQLVRVLAAEQAYRALTILTGHPYHRA